MSIRKTGIRIVLIFVLAVGLAITLAACAKDDGGDVDLDDIVSKLCSGADVPAYEVIPLDKETFSAYAFTEYDEGYQAVAADALVNITPHSLVVIKTEKGNGEELAQDIIENADPNKWLCVRSEKVSTLYTDDYVILIMSYADVVDDISENFKAWAKSALNADAGELSFDNAIE